MFLCLSSDARKVGLRFPLHLVIVSCLQWWRISPSHIVPNSWRYLVVFIGECCHADITLTRKLFAVYLRLCKAKSNSYLVAREDFKVSSAPSNNKGWKERFFLIGTSRD